MDSPANNTTTVTYDLDLLNGKLGWSETLYSVYGYPPMEMANTLEWWTDHIHPDDAMILNEAMDRLTDRYASTWTVRYRFRRGDNTYVRVSDHATVIRDANGAAVRLLGFLTPEA